MDCEEGERGERRKGRKNGYARRLLKELAQLEEGNGVQHWFVVPRTSAGQMPVCHKELLVECSLRWASASTKQMLQISLGHREHREHHEHAPGGLVPHLVACGAVEGGAEAGGLIGAIGAVQGAIAQAVGVDALMGAGARGLERNKTEEQGAGRRS